MASTSLFAPQVRSVQPAFIYDNNLGEVKIYFSLSSFNKKSDFKTVLYTIIDPNKSSTWSNNSMLKEDTYPAGKGSIDTDFLKEKSNEFILTLNLDPAFKEFNLNQYYQVQLYLSKNSPNEAITEKWLNDNADFISTPSQVTLIRPIEEPVFSIDGLQNGSEVSSNLIRKLKGHLDYPKSKTTIEYLLQYRCIIKDQSKNQLFDTQWIKNIEGMDFTINLDFLFEEGKSYILEFDYQTVNGYKPSIKPTYSVSIVDYQADNFPSLNFSSYELINKSALGAIELILKNIKTASTEVKDITNLLIQRSEGKTGFSVWEDIIQIKAEGDDVNFNDRSFVIRDHFISGDHLFYKYRIIQLDNNDNAVAASKDEMKIESDFEDIFLCNKEKQLPIKYNPNITGFKWVTQDSITNSLGGRYPIVRRNGDSKYRQFNLSGTLYFDPDTVGFDSVNSNLSQFFPNETSTLFISINEVALKIWNLTNWKESLTDNQHTIYENRFKEAAIDFLTDGKPKLFKSPTEGLILVHLTNVSFTPNKTLGRRIYDFSATLTEFAEANEENLARYGVEPSVATSYYVLEAISTEVETIYVTPLVEPGVGVDINQDSKEIYLRLKEKWGD